MFQNHRLWGCKRILAVQVFPLGLSGEGHKYEILKVPPEEGIADKRARSTNSEFEYFKPKVICAIWFACPCLSSTLSLKSFTWLFRRRGDWYVIQAHLQYCCILMRYYSPSWQ